jgi:PAS domain S-box-containing protein
MKTPRSLATVAEQLSDAIVFTDPQGRVTWLNPAFIRLCGYTLDEMRGRKPGSLLQGPDTDPETVSILRHAIREREPVTVELVNYRKNGEPYTVSIALSPLRNRAGRLTGFMAVERETSDVQREIRRLENEIAQLYSILCHVGGAPAA